MKKAKKLSILEIYKNPKKNSEKLLLTSGWIRSVRNSKNMTFLTINDGSTIKDLQVTFKNSNISNFENIIQKINFGSFIEIEGTLIFTPERKQSFELVGGKFISSSTSNENYPLQKKELSFLFLREKSHLRSKTKFFLAILKIRSELNKIVSDFFFKEKFFYVNTPIITTNDAEGGGESFKIETENKNFFEKVANLTVSGQLHQEVMVQGMGKVYNFSPCFRAENSNTTKHLSEFWMIEAEMCSYKIKDLMKFIEKFIKFILKKITKSCKDEIKYLEEQYSKKILEELEKIYKNKFLIVSYKKCLEILNIKKQEEKNFFEFNDIKWGIDFKTEHEKYLCDYFKSPIFIINYPLETKAFYTKINKDNKTVSAVDLIFPQIGELVGGSVREDIKEKMIERIKSEKLKKELDWYIKIRDYGYSGSAGFGMGLERLIMLITKCNNIRETIHFFRSSKELEF